MTLVTKQNVYVLEVLMGPSGIEEGGELVGASGENLADVKSSYRQTGTFVVAWLQTLPVFLVTLKDGEARRLNKHKALSESI